MASPIFARKRMQVIRLLSSVLPKSLACEIESTLRWSLPNEDPKFMRLYGEKARMLLFNLRNPKNSRLREDVRAGKICPDQLIGMNAQELFPEAYADMEARIQEAKRQARAEETRLSMAGIHPAL